jgi:hypothetical protein
MQLKQAQVHATWYGDAIAVTILGSSSRFFNKIVQSSRGMQMGFYVHVARVLCCTVRTPEPAMQTATIIHYGRIGLLSFFLPLRQLAAPNLFRTIDSCHGSIGQKRSGGILPADAVVSSFTGRRSISGVFSVMAKKTPDIFLSRWYLCLPP